jgi:hypothetical protein
MWESIDGLSTLIRLATWGIVITLLLGSGLTAFTIVADKKRERLVRKQDSAKDQYIADTNKLAGDANERAGKATQRAEELTQENIKLKGAFDRSTAETLLREEELKAINLATESKLEQERKTRLELEQSLAPRILPFQLGPGDHTSFDVLKPFAGIEVIVGYLPDAEATRATDAVRNVIGLAGWKIISTVPRPDVNMGYFDGVVVETNKRAWLEQDRKKELFAARTLVEFLKSNDWEARVSISTMDDIPKNTIRVIIGFKPNPYFEPEWVKEAKEKSKKMNDEMKKMEQNFPRFPEKPLPPK